MSRNEFIDEIKRDSFYKIDNIDYSKVMALELYIESIFYLFKVLIETIFFKQELNFKENKNSKILVWYAHSDSKRRDTDYIINKYKEILNETFEFDEVNLKRKIDFLGVIPRICLIIKVIFKLRKKTIKFSDKIYVATLLSKYMWFKSRLNLDTKKYKLLTTFFDGHKYDNLVTQIFKNNLIKTSTLQHGQYRYLSKKQEDVDREVYENFISDYLFAWGEKTKEEFLKYGIAEERIKVLGALKPYSFNINKSQQVVDNVFGVILDGENNIESNVKMIKLANTISTKNNIDYILRCHPKNNFKFYKKYTNENCIGLFKNMENNEYFSKVKYSICHMTGVYNELLMFEHPFFVYKDERLADIFDNDLNTIEDYESFILKEDLNLSEIYNLKKSFNNYKNIKENYLKAVEKILSEV